MLKDLLKDIKREKYKGEILIANDGSVTDYSKVTNFTEMWRFPNNRGRKRYYEIVSFLYDQLRHREFKYFWQLPDDVRLAKGFFSRSITLWQAIKDTKKICLSTGHTHDRITKPNWTKHKPIDLGDVVHTQWNDLCFIAEREYLEVLKYDVPKVSSSRWRIDGNLGSGVGSFISHILNKKGFNMYHCKESLVEFPANESVMQL